MTENDLIDRFTIPIGRRLVKLCDPQPEDIDFRWFIEALAKQCRYNGMCSGFYSVAEHLVVCSQYAARIAPEHRKASLLHDFQEAAIGDMIRPVKHLLRSLGSHAFDDLEAKWERAVEVRFGLRDGALSHPTVKAIDNAVGAREQLELRREILPEGWAPPIDPADVDIRGLGWGMAAMAFRAEAKAVGL